MAGMHELARLQPLTEVIGTECGPVVVLLASSLKGLWKVPLVLAYIASASLSFMPMRASVQLFVLLPMREARIALGLDQVGSASAPSWRQL